MVWRLIMTSVIVAMMGSGTSSVVAQTQPLAPGVLTVISTNREYEETYSGPMEMVEIVKGLSDLDWKPNYLAKSRTVFERSKLTILRREIWNFEFSFMPVRTVYVDVPQPSGKMQRKLIWYMVYRLRYLGGDLQPQGTKDAWGHVVFDTKRIAREGRFCFPRMLLQSHRYGKTYLDRVMPSARKPIEEIERKGRPLLNSVEISKEPIGISTPDSPNEVWGLATWEDIDPRVDYFSILVQGLTNAYKPVDLPDAFQPGDPPGKGRDYLEKTLVLNFWRPGDSIREHEDQIYFGVPYDADPQRQNEILVTYGVKERLDYLWRYR